MAYHTKYNNKNMVERLLEFEHIFPGEESQPIANYLKDCSKEMIRGVSTFFLSFKNINTSHSNKKLIKELFCQENKKFGERVYAKILEFEEQGVQVNIINHYSSLRLFEIYYDLEDAEDSQTPAEFEINLLKAYLLLNTEWTKMQEKAMASVDKAKEELAEEYGVKSIPLVNLLVTFFPTFDKDNYDVNQVWLSQLYRSILFLQFIADHPKGKKLWDTFLNIYNCKSWQDYLKKLIPITLSSLNFDNERHTTISVKNDECFDENCDFLEKIILEEYGKEEDFRSLREKPLYRIDKGEYRIIFNLFVIQKLYKGLYFTLRNINDSLPAKDRISKNFRQFVTDNFSEQTLCYKVLDSIYPKCKVKKPGREILKMGITGEPDYYIRVDNNILLFESKDVLISAEKKMSYDYEIYDKEFENKFYYHTDKDGKEIISAVVQLIKNVKKVLNKEVPFDNQYREIKTKIYPILITYEMEYDTPGLNMIVNSWFEAELSELKEKNPYLRTYQVNPLVIINIDTLIYYMDYLNQKVQLHTIIQQFLVNNNFFKSYYPFEDLSFSFFLSNYIGTKYKQSRDNTNHKIIKDMIPSLFPEKFSQQ